MNDTKTLTTTTAGFAIAAIGINALVALRFATLCEWAPMCAEPASVPPYLLLISIAALGYGWFSLTPDFDRLIK